MEPTTTGVASRFDGFLDQLDDLTPTTEKQIERRLRELRRTTRGRPARKKTKRREQRASSTALAKPLPRVALLDKPAEQQTSLPPLAPAPKQDAAAARKRLAAGDARQAACDNLTPGARCWGLIPDRCAGRVPCTLAVVAAPPTLVWHETVDNQVRRRAWRWGDRTEDGEPGWVGLDRATRRVFERRLCGSHVDAAGDSYGEARRHRRAKATPLVVLKVTAAFRASEIAAAARRAADAIEPQLRNDAAAASGHACSFYAQPKAARAALQALLFTEPLHESIGEAGVVLQRYVQSKDGKPWVVRAVVDATAAANLHWAKERGGERATVNAGPWAKERGHAAPQAWVFSESSPEAVATSAERCVGGSCSVVKSTPGSAAWTDAKVLTAAVLRGLNGVLPSNNQVAAVACDCVQDEAGRWSVLQIKGVRGGPAPFECDGTWRPPAQPESTHEQHRAPRCEGAYCDVAIPAESADVYQDAVARGLMYSVPRKVVLDKPRGGDATPTAASLVRMSRRQRLALYDAVKVCTHCHFAYCGPTAQRVLRKPPPTRERVQEQADAIDEALVAAAAPGDTDEPPGPLATLLRKTAAPKEEEVPFVGDSKDKEIRDLRRQIAKLTAGVPAPPPSAPPPEESWIFQLGVPKAEEGLGATEPGPDAAATIRGAEGELDAIFQSHAQFLDDIDIVLFPASETLPPLRHATSPHTGLGGRRAPGVRRRGARRHPRVNCDI